MGLARLAGDRQDQGVTSLERENDRLKRIVAEKELELDISRILGQSSAHEDAWPQVRRL